MTSLAIVPRTEPAKPVNWKEELTGAQMLLKSGLLPKSLTAEAAMFVILAGRDLGLSPVQSLRSINIIQGKVEVAADMQLGLFHRAGGKSQWLELTNEVAVLQLVAPWLVKPHTERFTLEDAKRAKLTGENWVKWPKAMCRSRAITAGLKSIGFDPTAGVYDYGEIGGPEPVLTAEVVESTEQGDATEGAEETTEEYPEERLALMEIEKLLPRLAENQQEYVRGKLGDGAHPLDLLPMVRQKAKQLAGEA